MFRGKGNFCSEICEIKKHRLESIKFEEEISTDESNEEILDQKNISNIPPRFE